MLVWNNTFTKGAGHGGRRTPLTAAISRDEGQTWDECPKNLESDPESHLLLHEYPLLPRAGALLTYWVTGPERGAVFVAVPLSAGELVSTRPN